MREPCTPDDDDDDDIGDKGDDDARDNTARLGQCAQTIHHHNYLNGSN